MNEAPRQHLILFLLLIVAGTCFDIYSKHVVFNDLGYFDPYLREPVVVLAGEHEIFENPNNTEGASRFYLDSWVSFQLVTSYNFGALWGVGQGKSWVFAGLSILAFIGIMIWAFVFKGTKSLWLTICLGLITSGTLGNLWDRTAMHGFQDSSGEYLYAVRDFLLFRFGGWPWPVFNFADVFLVTGAIMLFLHTLLTPDPAKETKPAQPQEASPPETASA